MVDARSRSLPRSNPVLQLRRVTGKARLTRKDSTDEAERAAVSAQLARAFGRRFRRARIEAGLKPKDVEAMTDVSRALLRQIEAGQEGLTLDTLAALARVIGVPASVLMAPLE